MARPRALITHRHPAQVRRTPFPGTRASPPPPTDTRTSPSPPTGQGPRRSRPTRPGWSNPVTSTTRSRSSRPSAVPAPGQPRPRPTTRPARTSQRRSPNVDHRETHVPPDRPQCVRSSQTRDRQTPGHPATPTAAVRHATTAQQPQSILRPEPNHRCRHRPARSPPARLHTTPAHSSRPGPGADRFGPCRRQQPVSVRPRRRREVQATTSAAGQSTRPRRNAGTSPAPHRRSGEPRTHARGLQL